MLGVFVKVKLSRWFLDVKSIGKGKILKWFLDVRSICIGKTCEVVPRCWEH